MRAAAQSGRPGCLLLRSSSLARVSARRCREVCGQQGSLAPIRTVRIRAAATASCGLRPALSRPKAACVRPAEPPDCLAPVGTGIRCEHRRMNLLAQRDGGTVSCTPLSSSGLANPGPAELAAMVTGFDVANEPLAARQRQRRRSWKTAPRGDALQNRACRTPPSSARRIAIAAADIWNFVHASDHSACASLRDTPSTAARSARSNPCR